LPNVFEPDLLVQILAATWGSGPHVSPHCGSTIFN
jgi:hypothetical protein